MSAGGKKLSLERFGYDIAAGGGEDGRRDPARERLLRTLRRVCEGELTARQKQCVRLYYGKGKSEKEIAALLGIHPSTVCRHLKKALGRVRRVLEYTCPGGA